MKNMRRAFLIFFLLFNFLIINGQENRINVIVVVNDKIVTVGIQNPSLMILENKDGTLDTSKIYYSPGELSIDTGHFNKINRLEYKKCRLRFNYIEFLSNGSQTEHEYEATLYSDWNRSRYIILYFYEMSISKYKKVFLSEDKFVYDIESDIYSVKALRRL